MRSACWAAALAVVVGAGCERGRGEGDDDDDAAADGDADADADGDSDADSDGDGDADGDADGDGDGDADGDLEPPLGGSSGGSGGGAANGDVRTTPGGVEYQLIVPGSYLEGTPNAAMIVISGTEGAAGMTSNLQQVAAFTGNDDVIFAVLDGVVYRGDGPASAEVLDDVRARYDVDNDRTYLFSESAGTTNGLDVGFHLRQSWFAAYWANDVNAQDVPAQTAEEIGFAPWGNAGPGGDFVDADAIVAGMQAAGYRTEDPSPYDGPDSDVHGGEQQFLFALSWFPGRTRAR